MGTIKLNNGVEMQAIESTDLGHSEIRDFENPATERLLMKLKIHE